MRALILIAALLLTAGCRVTGGRWVVEEPVVGARVCPGGVINQERRFVDTFRGWPGSQHRGPDGRLPELGPGTMFPALRCDGQSKVL